MKNSFANLFRFLTSGVGLASTQLSLRVCLENGFQVAQATRLCRPATRRTQRKQRFEAMRTAFPPHGSPHSRLASRQPGRASRQYCSASSLLGQQQQFSSPFSPKKEERVG